MRKIFTVLAMSVTVMLMLGGAYASAGIPGLYFDCNADGKYDSRCNAEVGKSIPLEIYLDDWQDSFPGEKLFGLSMFFYYDKDKIEINKFGSFANDTEHGSGVFDPSFVAFYDNGEGKIQLEVANFDCVDIEDRLLLFTLDMKPLMEGKTDIGITVDFNEEENGSVSPAGTDCSDPYLVDCGDSEVQVIVAAANDNGTGEICAAAYALDRDDSGLETLRHFRDSVLKKNAAGKKLIDLYYKNSDAVTDAMKKYPQVKKCVQHFLKTLLPIMKTISD